MLRPDGRSRSSHLRPWRDGWRHLRFLLLYSPSWLFLLPGLVMLSIGLLGSVLLTLGPRRMGSVVFDINTLLVMALLVIIGFQVIVFAVSTRIFAIRAGLLPESPTLDRLYRYVTLETGLLAGAVLLLLGLAGLGHRRGGLEQRRLRAARSASDDARADPGHGCHGRRCPDDLRQLLPELPRHGSH